MSNELIQFCLILPILVGLQGLLVVVRRDVTKIYDVIRLENMIPISTWFLIILYLAELLSAVAITVLLFDLARRI